MVETLKNINIYEEFLSRFIDFIISFGLNSQERIKSERRLRSYCSIYAKELEIDKD
jgi:uncharacterized protein YaaR (DUF327 family)